MTSLLPSEPPGRDYYTEFIEGSRWLRKEQADARTAWFEDLPWEHKEGTLFRFEMLLKALVCFGNPANHPGPRVSDPSAMSRDFGLELGLVRSILREIVSTGRILSGDKDNSSVFRSYLMSVVAQDHARMQMTKQALTQDTPEQSLSLLLSAMKDQLDVNESIALEAGVSSKLFASVVRIAQREIQRSEYFNPLTALEFRVEFDRIQVVEVLEVIAAIESDPARRVTALAFLALFRLMRYLDLIREELAVEDGGVGPLFAFLALLRSEASALSLFMTQDAAAWMSEGFARTYERYEPDRVKERFGDLEQEYAGLKSLRELIASVGNQLDLELRKVFEQQIPPLEAEKDAGELTDSVYKATASLRSFMQNSIVLLAREFRSDLEGEEVFVDFTSDRARSERLRRDIWMFQQILRAFVAKARGTEDATDQWAGMSTFRFVREFVKYFKSMGYQLLRYSDYARFDNFMSLIDRLGDGDVLDVKRLTNIVSACEDFHGFLGQMFDAVGRREELAGEEFDRKDAARTLKLFLGH